MVGSGGKGIIPHHFQKTVANMLMGSYQHNIDAKSRVIMPAKFREELGEVFYATKGTDESIMVLSQQGWDDFGKKICSLPSAQAKDLRRFFFSAAAELMPDKQGRVLSPQTLRDFAHLDKDVMIIGTGTIVEIWDLDRWNKYNRDISQSQVVDVMNMYDI